MPLQMITRLLVALAVALPALIFQSGAANAQKFVSKKKIVNQLQKKKRRANRNNSQRQRVSKRRAPSSQQRVTKRRAPQNSNNRKLRSRAPSKVAKRRAPPRNNQRIRAPKSDAPSIQRSRAPSKVAKRRAPSGSRQQLRAPQPANGGVAKRRAPRADTPSVQRSRAPTKVVKRRAPPRRDGVRAPRQDSPSVQPSRAPTRVVKRRAPPRRPNVVLIPQAGGPVIVEQDTPRREPQHFGNQIASVDGDNERGIEIIDREEAGSVDLEILFDYNSADISPKSLRQLIELGEALQDEALRDSRIVIAGHTDAAGGNDYNIDLSYRRAEAVSRFLSEFADISTNRLVVEGYGEEALKYPDAPNSGQNRRVEIINLGS